MIAQNKRQYISSDLEVNWEKLQPVFDSLLQQPIERIGELENWLKHRSELEAFLQEDYAWRYIRMTCDTSNDDYNQAFEYFAVEIEPKLASYTNQLDKKLIGCPFIFDLDQNVYGIYIKKIQTSLEIFREANIPLFTEIQLLQQEYQSLTGGLTILHGGQELTMQQAAALLEDTDRNKREVIWKSMSQKRLSIRENLDVLFDKLVKLRHQVALNAGFDNFRDYMFVSLGRFDYTAQDCKNFHEAIANEVVPFIQTIAEQRKNDLGYNVLKPWDLMVDPKGRAALSPFKNGEELITKSKQSFAQLDPYFANCIQYMEDHNLFDVESRKNKAPGGYNYPLAESGAPFIFMNSANTFQDLSTMIHEGGHAVHTFLTADLALNDFKDVPSEVAELASMSMELMSMGHWDNFFADKEQLQRAYFEQITSAASTLPWVAIVDKFQHWIYTNPNHTAEERKTEWVRIFKEFGQQCCDWQGQEEAMQYLWHKQLHIFEVPFYYIEYAIAQLGAISIWKNFEKDSFKTIKQYKDALKLGYTKSIPDIYSTAGIRFDFGKEYIKSLVQFLSTRIKNLEAH